MTMEATGSPLFNVPAAVLGSMLGQGRRRAYPAGAVVHRADEVSDEFFYLEAGLLKQVLQAPGGSEKALGLVTPGCTFGEALFVHRCPALSTVIAVEPSVVYSIPRAKMDLLLAAHPVLWAEIARSLSFKVRVLTTQLWIETSDDSATKIGKVLYVFSEAGATSAPIRLTHQAVADLAGVHRVTASVAMGELRKRGVLESSRGHLVVKQRDRLLGVRPATNKTSRTSGRGAEKKKEMKRWTRRTGVPIAR